MLARTQTHAYVHAHVRTYTYTQAGRTTVTLKAKYPTLLKFYLGYMFWESATGAVTTLTGTMAVKTT